MDFETNPFKTNVLKTNFYDKSIHPSLDTRNLLEQNMTQ